MTTEDLIQKLSGDLKNPSESKHWFARYWSVWVLCIIILTAITYAVSLLAPEEVHVPENLGSSIFRMEVFMWFGIAVLASTVAYLSSIPRKSNSFLIPGVYAAMAALIISLITRLNFAAFLQDFNFEMQLWRGPCGFFIAITGTVATLTMYSVMRRAAPTQLQKTATWSALSIGAFAAMLMHTVCTHDSSTHVFLWHILPMTMMIILARFSSKKLLHW